MEGAEKMSYVYQVTNCPVPRSGENYHRGLDALLQLMGNNGLKFYKAKKEALISGPQGLIEKEDVVLIKVNAQWKYRGCTNSDVVKGLIQRILDHPEGFKGEVVILDNGQGEGSLDGNAHGWGKYPDPEIHANAEDESHSYSYLIEKVFPDPRVSGYLLDEIREEFTSSHDHTSQGYRKLSPVSYPCFTTTKGNRIELKEGIWNGTSYQDNLKLINFPVLKHHVGCGVTACLKNFYGVLSMADGNRKARHYQALGEHCAKMITLVRTPIINILDCIWVSRMNHYGYPPQGTTRLNELLASLDPIALDYWSAKHVLYPLDENEEHHPDKFPQFRDYLIRARDIINSSGGIRGEKVFTGDSNINLISGDLSKKSWRKG